jgi:hypothetical protein
MNQVKSIVAAYEVVRKRCVNGKAIAPEAVKVMFYSMESPSIVPG